MAYASSTLSLNDKPASDHTVWSNDFRRLVTDAHTTSNQITSVRSLLSSCLSNGQALPPYLEMPQPYAFVRRLESIDKNILSVRHIGEPEYSAFAVLQICGGSVTADLEKLVKYVSIVTSSYKLPMLTFPRHVRTLVGEIDFSFHALSPNGGASSGTSSDASSWKTSEQRKVE